MRGMLIHDDHAVARSAPRYRSHASARAPRRADGRAAPAPARRCRRAHRPSARRPRRRPAPLRRSATALPRVSGCAGDAASPSAAPRRGRKAAMVALPPVVAARCARRAPALPAARARSRPRTSPPSRKRTSVFAGCTLTSTSRGSMRDEQRHHRMPVARQIIGIGRRARAPSSSLSRTGRPLTKRYCAERIGAA